ncbi:hypothetical protein FGSG_05752 [Fusarium graminearum PH-1]|uniref:Chromosome 3, complete genome n=1 Tax=Gibberella zeae (strain ATCC MYA-4620 / CBS 123657 / FGSC 9075 / NRRL 31084 / PH-1) TaxID=229533 RepID=I1RP04_GIBZE|nr:hypothetical protein FGSG_05752 [Fusarium graminearum PH-1]ESU11759.1 hypothetical protein FGSG_05752 [Fusarium graminearum PH-1]CEF88399.1 unnamed protein product [Fusarium graminearum]|eukprot:XP_011324335.1 hypothetical protein FGSG_05752 [Fusarium graminearum PH-1]
MSDQPPSFEESMTTNPPIFKTQFACMTLNMMDRIRLINFTEVEVQAVKQIVKTRWKPGLVQSHPYGDSTEIWLRGRPWAYDSNGNDDARRLILWILERLFDHGWVVQCSLDITKKSESKVDSPPKDLTDAILQTFSCEVRRREITSEKFKIHLGVQPWEPSGTDTVTTRILLLRLIETLERRGFTIYATIGSKGEDDEGAADLLICHRAADWVPGAPIWHR